MKAIIIGGAGFVGPYLARHLTQDLHWETRVTKLPHESFPEDTAPTVDLDITNPAAIADLLRTETPDIIFHLAAQSSVAVAWKKPALTAEINVIGAINLLEALRTYGGTPPRTILIGSSEEYGAPPLGTTQIDEETPLHPRNPYAVTKVAQNMFGMLYADAYQLPIITVRAFNHIGIGQSPQFVVADFCHQVTAIRKRKMPPQMHVGNLSVARDFTDVRDVVRAYTLLAQYGHIGQTYNVGSGYATPICDLLEEIIRQSGVDIRVIPDPEKIRPSETPTLCADITKLQRDTGWTPQIPLSQTIADILDDLMKKE